MEFKQQNGNVVFIFGHNLMPENETKHGEEVTGVWNLCGLSEE